MNCPEVIFNDMLIVEAPSKYYLYKITYSDLRHTPIYEQFDSGDITAVIRSEEWDEATFSTSLGLPA
jgi:hypothetical protein